DRVSLTFDPVVNNVLIGSGPFECRSVFPSDAGSIGGGCVVNADGTRGIQATAPGADLILRSFDNTGPGMTDPFNQYMRSFNPNWATGTGTAAESGQFQEFSYADMDGNNVVDLSDLASVAACFGSSSATASCPTNTYAYWQKSSFESVPGTI